MQARTKKQKAIIEVSNTLPEITKEQINYAYLHCFKRVAYRSKTKGTGCLECGHIWQLAPKIKTCTCPGCGVKLAVEDTKAKKMDEGKMYFTILDVLNDYQVVRIFEAEQWHEKGNKKRQRIWEVVQQFFTEDSQMQVVARCRTTSFNVDSFGGSLECRSTEGYYGNKYDFGTHVIYPKMKLLPCYVRNGFNYKADSVSTYEVMHSILRNTKAETLIKAKQFGLLAACIGNRRSNLINLYWSSIKICLRKKIIIKDDEVGTWLDYLDMLDYLGKDLNSPHYLFPKNLKEAHDYCVKKKNILQAQRAKERERQKAINDEADYIKSKGIFFGIVIQDEQLTIKVLETIQEFMDEGQVHHHCVASYYNRPDSLVMSAKVDGKPVETVEVSLSEMRVVQARGLQNKASEYHDKIIDLVRKNMHFIKEKMPVKVKKAKKSKAAVAA